MAAREQEKASIRAERRKSAGPRATLRHLRVSARKARLVVDLVRGKGVEEALNILQFNRRRVARDVRKLLASAVANAEHRGGYDADRLFVSTAFVDEGPTLRRWLSRAMGRATRIHKRTSHITVVLAQK